MLHKTIMQNINTKIQIGIQKAFTIKYQKNIPIQNIRIMPTPKNFVGSHTVAVHAWQNIVDNNIQDIAQNIGKYLVDKNIIISYQVVKGFLNLSLHDSTWINAFKQLYTHKNLGIVKEKKRKIAIEYASPNTNKPLHLGHLRNIFLGDAISNILSALGHDVVKVNLINDRGIHICKSMVAYQLFGLDETPSSSQMKGDHFVGKFYVLYEKIHKIAAMVRHNDPQQEQTPIQNQAINMLQNWEKGDKEVIQLWQKMNKWVYNGFQKTLERIKVCFDKTYYESDTYLLGKKMVYEGLKKNIFQQKNDKSIWIDLEKQRLDNKLLLRSDGTTVYMTQDLGSARIRYQDIKFDQSIYVVGNEQDYHFKTLKAILHQLEEPYAPYITHLSYGMVDLPSGKMKSREGKVVDADNLMDEMLEHAKAQSKNINKTIVTDKKEKKELHEIIALGALKYFLLKVESKKKIVFDPKASIDLHGYTATFIQYTYARICSVIQHHTSSSWFSDLDLLSLEKEEKNLIIHIVKFSDKLREAAHSYTPSILAHYVYDLAKLYNQMYASLPILHADNNTLQQWRLILSAIVARILQYIMHMLGVELPQKM